MKAIYLRSCSALSEARAEAGHIAGYAADEDVRAFAADAPVVGFPFKADDCGHLLYPAPAKFFRAVMHHRSQVLLDGTWARAYLHRLYHAVERGGKITLPGAEPREASRRGLFGRADMEVFFGQCGRVQEEGYVTFERRGDLPPVDSALTWYYAEHGRLGLDDMLLRPALEDADPESVRRGLGDLARPGHAWPELLIRGRGPSDARAVARKHAYWMGGLAAKSAILRRIILDHFRPDARVTLVDHGGGLGLVPAELLLDDTVPVTSAINCDADIVNIVLSQHLHRFFHDKLAGRFFAQHACCEDFLYDGPCQVVSFIGSLLYVPRDRVLGALARAWEALEDDGILIMHENVRTPRHEGGADYEVMFPREELETLLGRFGAVSYYASSVAAPLRPEQVGDKTVFRVVAKGRGRTVDPALVEAAPQRRSADLGTR